VRRDGEESGRRGDGRERTWLHQVQQDVRHAIRLMRWNPGFTIVTILTLAMGLSTNVTIFSLINLLLFKPLPVKDGSRLVVLLEQQTGSDSSQGISWADYRDYRTQVPELSDTLALVFRPAHLSLDGRLSDRTWIEGVSGNYFTMLGATPLTGRLFLSGEGETPGADPIVVLSHHYWQTRLGGDPGIVGRSIGINGRALTVVGVTRPEFSGAQWALAPSAFVPAMMLPELFPEFDRLLDNRAAGAFRVMAHLRRDVDLRQATAAVQVVAERLRTTYRPEDTKARVIVWPELKTRPIPGVSRFVPLAAAVFMATAALVLFIACANVASLMFSRALARQKEMGIRTAIGASRGRLLRQLLTESVVLALLAGFVGMTFSYASGTLLARVAPQGDVPVRTALGWDWSVALFTVIVSVIAGVLTGVVPALRSTTLDVNGILKGTAAGAGGVGPARFGFRAQLVISQVAVCVLVLVCGGLFLQGLWTLTAHDLGFRRDRLLMASLDLGLPGLDETRGRQLLEQIVEKARALPGVDAVALASSVPFGNSHEMRSVTRPEEQAPVQQGRRASEIRAGVNRVDPGYLGTMGAALLQGRDFTPDDRLGAPRVAIVNQTFARRVWPNESALGRRFRWRGDTDPIEVIGVVRDGKYISVGENRRAYAYVPLAQHYEPVVTLHVRAATGDPFALAPSLRRLVNDLDSDVPVFNVRTMDEHLQDSVFAFLPIRMGALLACAQGLLGLVLAMISVYGVVAYTVRQQTRGIGIRVALGARKRDLFLLVARSALRPTLIGLVLGIAVSLAFARVLGRLLYGIAPVNLPLFVAVAGLVAGLSLLACWLPARRVSRVDPVIALRAE